jgi:SulP family sulfate permease
MKFEVGFSPRLLEALKNYSFHDFLRDCVAGVTVGIVALSLSMALGIASNSTPAAGIYTAVVAGFLISALGGSKVQIGGPTAAFIPIVVSVSAAYGLENLIICTLMAGLMLVAMGLMRMGTMIKYIPFPVTAGFTAGIAVVIFSTQVKDFLGLTLDKNPGEFIERLTLLAGQVKFFQWPSLLLAAASLALIKLWPASLGRRVPASIVVVVGGMLAVAVFHLDVATIGSRYGEQAIPQSLPMPHWPVLDMHNLQNLIRPAFTIALLAAIESLLSAVVADGMVGDRHDSNQELVGQGVANMFSALFGGLPATGAIARTATNVRSGARSPVAGMVHALTLLGIILLAAPLTRYIPLPTLSAVLVNVALMMGEWHNLWRLSKWPKSDAAVFLATFGLTVVFDITIAVEVGMVLAAFLFIRRISETTRISGVDEAGFDESSTEGNTSVAVPKGVLVYSVFGAFLFGAADKLETALQRAQQEPEVLILKMRQVLAMDATGLQALEDLARRLRTRGKHLLLCGPHSQPLFAMNRHGFTDWLGQDNVCADLELSLVRARELLGATAGGLPSAADAAKVSEATP